MSIHATDLFGEGFYALLDSIPDALVISDENGNISLVNAQTERIFGYRQEEVLGWPIEILMPRRYGRTHKKYRESYMAAPRLRPMDGSRPRLGRRKDGTEFPVDVGLSPLQTGHGLFITCIIHDVSEHKRCVQQLQEHSARLEESNARLAALASTDGLTGIPNRRAFEENLEKQYSNAIRYHLPISVIIADIDNFKLFNDTFGHPAGDAALRAVAGLLDEAVRSGDLVARYGGEEFGILLTNARAAESLAVSERLRRVIAAHPWPLSPLTMSFGVSTLTSAPVSCSQLLQEADQALYFSKRQGRNGCTHFQTIFTALCRSHPK
ncbi:MAG TPA: diguanylate cyclase [Chthonomonadaceae bacterium]|nr:diguanylate cyclase [Chthonomonadaceae bacterium]